MREVALDQFVKRTGHWIERVRNQHDEVAITAEGRVIAWLEPAERDVPNIDTLRRQWGQAGRIGDVVSPVEEEWRALT